jgi:pimeloyl-ACP methyl ester carboxylesterase
MNLFYLHGFASSPGTTKGRFFADKLATLGLSLHLPDLNAGDFGRLTMTRMIEVVCRAVSAAPEGPVYLIGSSMGARVALCFLDRHRQAEAARVAGMLFLAPAFEFSLTNDEMSEWRARGEVTVYHYGYQKEMPLRYDLAQDLTGYDSYTAQTYGVPILIYHGRQDGVVDHRQSLRFAAGRENVQVLLVESDHLLHDQLETIWAGCVDFFGLGAESKRSGTGSEATSYNADARRQG